MSTIRCPDCGKTHQAPACSRTSEYGKDPVVKPKLTALFKARELKLLDGSFLGKYLVIHPTKLKIEFCKRKFLVWRAEDGFGCAPGLIGRAVYATCVGDGESARWNRNDFVYEFVGDPLALAAED